MLLPPPKATKNQGWVWVYKKIRKYGFSRFTAFYRTTLYILRGDTGTFISKHGWTKFRFRR